MMTAQELITHQAVALQYVEYNFDCSSQNTVAGTPEQAAEGSGQALQSCSQGVCLTSGGSWSCRTWTGGGGGGGAGEGERGAHVYAQMVTDLSHVMQCLERKGRCT